MSQGAPVPDEQYIAQQRIAPESVRKAVFLKPLSQDRFLAQVHNNLGVVYSERKDYSAAAREYDEALRLDKHLPAAWYNQVKMLAEQKDFRGAVRSFSKGCGFIRTTRGRSTTEPWPCENLVKRTRLPTTSKLRLYSTLRSSLRLGTSL